MQEEIKKRALPHLRGFNETFSRIPRNYNALLSQEVGHTTDAGTKELKKLLEHKLNEGASTTNLLP